MGMWELKDGSHLVRVISTPGVDMLMFWFFTVQCLVTLRQVCLQLFDFLIVETHVNCKVSRGLRSLIDSSLPSRYRMALDLAGCQDGPASKLSIRERLELLKSRELSWRSLQPIITTVQLKKRNDDGPMFRSSLLVDGVYAYNTHSRIEFIQTPSAQNNNGLRRWSHSILDMNLLNFTIDPSRDLLILLEIMDM